MPSKNLYHRDAACGPRKLQEQAKTDTKHVARVISDSLFQGASVLELEHNGQIYRLQITALNKLILTK